MAAPVKDKDQKPFGSSRHVIHHTGLLLLFGFRGQSTRAAVPRLACWGRRWGGAPCGVERRRPARVIWWGRVIGATGGQPGPGGRAGMRQPAVPWIWDFGAGGWYDCRTVCRSKERRDEQKRQETIDQEARTLCS